ncbi:MAG: undecaprenyl-phosphate glucose phosphotransferase [Planctomycetales bacterium]|nr:undecaprenyl-phosphate glucose phosphotransferase [Planctomycetales bacterium]
MYRARQGIQQHRSLSAPVYRVVDAVCILAALYGAAQHTILELTQAEWLAGAVAIALFYVISELTGMYRSWRGVSVEREMVCALITWGWTLLVMLVIGFSTRGVEQYPRSFGLLWMLFAPPLMTGSRLIGRRVQHALRARGFGARGFAIVGATGLGIQLARNIQHAPELGLRLIGFYDDRSSARVADLPADVGDHIGNLNDLVEAARAGQVNMIYITFPMKAEERVKQVLAKLADTTASVYLVPDFFVFELLHSRWTNIGGLPVVSIFENPLYGVDGVVKRVFDVAVASLLLLILALPMSIIALLVKLTSPGPVFFRQKRYGLDGREILVWKFRSMRVCENGPVVTQATQGDPRVTRVGAILRSTSLDELPQLFNVIEGTMSLVGPRPHASAHNEQFRTMIQGYMLRHKVKPGITGLAQVSGWRGETDTLEKMAKRIECDHRYIREWSLWMDIKILFKTIFVVMSKQNAY